MGTVVAHYPISLFDHEQKKLEMHFDEQKMWKDFEEKYLKDYKYPSDRDEYRPPYTNNYYGGVDFSDAKTTGLIRGIGWDLIKSIGKKIISGDFNLTTITIPIRVMIPLSILQHLCNSHFNFPFYLNLASKSSDPLERMKLVIVASMSCWHRSLVFLKPLNPILGETYEMIWEDGAHEYVEQTSHHPPVSHFLINGPNNNYKYYGYVSFVTNAWFNSCNLTNVGKRTVEVNGSVIEFQYAVDHYSNTFWGTFRHESIGELSFEDKISGLKAEFKMGNIVGKLSDYFQGEIVDKEGNSVSSFSGSYLTNIEFDGVRYWDVRKNIDIEAFPVKDQIKSSSIYREDSNFLYEKKLEEAQEAKDKLENLQRHDRKLRAKYNN